MNKAVKYYLATYNFIAFGFWLTYIISFLSSWNKFTETSLWLLNIAQGIAILEILHAILKWVKSPVLSTAVQIFSRILVVALIDLFYLSSEQWPIPVTIAGIGIVSVAWSITELVRYSFYFLSLFDKQPYWLLWMRYSFFIILYPLGVTGEWFIIITPLTMHFSFGRYTALAGFLALAYLYYFPVLYRYMWRQRKAKL